MMKNKHVLSGIPVILLAFALVFTACENGTTEVEGAVDISSQEAPVVTAKAVKGGVLLEWNPIIGAGYSVWRKAGNAEAIQLSSSGDYLYQDKETGKVRYLDLVSDTNALTKNTEYTYTVVATGASQTIGKTEVKATPTDIPERGTKLDPVSGVTLQLSSDTETITVSWTAGAVSSRYYVYLYLNDSSVSNTYTSLGETKALLSWTSDDQTEGEYTARVTAYIPGSSPYFKNSDYAASEKQKYEALFDSSSNPYASSPQAIGPDGTLTGFSVSISFNSAKPGATYAVERAPVDAAGNAGDYKAITLYANASDTTALTVADLTANEVGLLKYSSVYDKSLPATAGKYKYRLKATKQGVTPQTKEIYSPITVDLRNYAYVSSISIGEGTENTEAHTKTYAVTPTLSYKGALQTGDKLVIYYVKGGASVDPTALSTYTKGIEFTKDQLEATTVEPRDLVIPKTDSDTKAYVQAYLVFADGRAPRNVTWYNGDGKSSSDSYQSGNSYIYYAILNY